MSYFYQTIEKTIDKSAEINVLTLKKRLQLILNNNHLLTVNKENSIVFSRLINPYPSGNQQSRFVHFKYIKNGSVTIVPEFDELKLIWSVELKDLYFIAILFSFIVLFFFYVVFNVSFIASFITQVCFVALYIVKGRIKIKKWIHKLNNTCLDL